MCTSRTRDFVHELKEQPNINYVGARIAGGDPRRRSIVRQAYEAVRLLVQVRPSAAMIVLPWPDAGLGLMLATASLHIPTAVVYQLAPWRLRLGRRSALYRWAHSRDAVWVAVSRQNRDEIAHTFAVDPESIRVIYNGAPATAPPDEDQDLGSHRRLREELQLPADARLVVTVGRLHVQKGHADLLRVIPGILEGYPDTFFIWIGDGPLRARIESDIRLLGLQNNVRILGHRGDVPRLLEGSDLFVMPSRFEGHPFALLEAMACGVPVITSDAGGAPEIVRENIDGIVYRREDTSELQAQLVWAIQHPCAMREMAASGRRRAGEFSEEQMIDEMVTVLEGLVE